MDRRRFLSLVGLATGGLIGCGTLEQAMLYRPAAYENEPLAPADASVKEVDLVTQAGTRIHARWCPQQGARQALILCHGNAGNLFQRAGEVTALMQNLNVSVLIFDYPGYGLSGGTPSEEGLYAAADAAYEWLTQLQQVPADDVLIYGESLGGGVAVDVASRKPHRALILVRTFTSIPDMAQKQLGFSSARSLVSSRYDSLDKIGKCRGPIFIAHGTRDSLIPFEQGSKLAVAAHEPKEFLPLQGLDHNDPLPAEFYVSLRTFLNRTDPAANWRSADNRPAQNPQQPLGPPTPAR